MSEKKKIVFLTNALWLKTGLSRNLENILKYLYTTGKYEIIHYCSGVPDNDPRLGMMPWKCYGAMPSNPPPNVAQRLQTDQVFGRQTAYGAYFIDKIIEEEKPDILWCSDDIWSFPVSEFADKRWANKDLSKTNKGCAIVQHITADSVPLLPDFYDMALKSHTYTWVSFAERELKKQKGKYDHVKTIHGCLDAEDFSILPDHISNELKNRFGISLSDKIFLYVFRNQVRKNPISALEALAYAKNKRPDLKIKLLLHTSWQEGWDLNRGMKEMGVSPNDILTTYICPKCRTWDIRPYSGNDLDCPHCGAEKTYNTSNIQNAVRESEMKLLYALSTACFNIANSGGFEYHSAQSLLAGKPLATIPYTYGEDYISCEAVKSLKFTFSREFGTSFLKATPEASDLGEWMIEIAQKSEFELKRMGEVARKFAMKFDYHTVGAQWEKVFDDLPRAEYNDEMFGYIKKNVDYPFKPIEDDKEWLIDLYKNVLRMEVSEHDEGLNHWLERISRGESRQSIYQYFIQVAQKENAENVGFDFNKMLGDEKKEDRIALVLPESLGDCILATALLPDIREVYPDKVIYFITKPHFKDVFLGNPNINRVIDWQPFMDNTMMMEDQYFEQFIQLHVQNQRFINYLRGGNDKTSINYNYERQKKCI